MEVWGGRSVHSWAQSSRRVFDTEVLTLTSPNCASLGNDIYFLLSSFSLIIE